MSADHDRVEQLLSPLDPESEDEGCLRLFLSVDIIGSTAAKTSISTTSNPVEFEQSREWLTQVREFYQEYPSLLTSALDKPYDRKSVRGSMNAAHSSLPTLDGSCLSERPRLLKGIGDELLFVVDVFNPRQVAYVILAFLASIREFNGRFRVGRGAGEMVGCVSPPKSRGTQLKGTAWLAGFPINNAEVTLPTDDLLLALKLRCGLDSLPEVLERVAEVLVRDVRRDYLGPSIDYGFRLGAFSTHRKVTISLDLAYILSHERVHSYFDFEYHGRARLAGVLGGYATPIIQLSNGHRLAEDDVEAAKSVGENDHIYLLCEEELNAFRDKSWLIRPYFCGSGTDQKIAKEFGMGRDSMPHRHRQLDVVRKQRTSELRQAKEIEQRLVLTLTNGAPASNPSDMKMRAEALTAAIGPDEQAHERSSGPRRPLKGRQSGKKSIKKSEKRAPTSKVSPKTKPRRPTR